jgi:acyl-CoA thioesterase
VKTEQMGRSVAFQRIEMHQADKLILLATGSWANGRDGIEYAAWEPPEVPAPHDCLPMTSVRPEGPFPIHQQWDIRTATGRLFGDGPPAEMHWWIRPLTHRPLDGPVLIAMSDALPPPIFMVSQPQAGVPTIDLTMHTRANLAEVAWAPGDWVLATFRTRLGADGYVEEDGELWTTDGVLLAQSRQLALSI